MSLYAVKHTFTKGDTDAVARYTIKRNGAVLNLTDYTAVTLYAKARGQTALTPIVGSIVSPATGGIVEFDHVTMAAADGAYFCQIKLTNSSGDTRHTLPFQNDVIVPVGV